MSTNRHPGGSLPDGRQAGRGPVRTLLLKCASWIPASAGMTVLVLTQLQLLHAQTLTGIDVLVQNEFKELHGRKIALITNHTGVDSRGRSTVDLLKKAPNVKLVCILSPEHGFRGEAAHGESVEDNADSITGLPVYSLYGKTTRPTAKMLEGVDTIVFDIQDIGTRFYTYITTMGYALEEAAKQRVRFVVLDRPNPIRGDVVQGDILDSDIKRMTGYFPIPIRHGFTVGELATWWNRTQKLGADLQVIRIKNWKRRMWFDETGLEFVGPSPNIRSLTAAFLYSGIGCFEATNVAVGRGTDTPFELFGAPWIEGKALCSFLREQNFPGVLFEPVEFTPAKDIYAGQKCEGVRIIVTSRNNADPLAIFLSAFLYLTKEYPKQFEPVWEEVRVVTGSKKLEDTAKQGGSKEDLMNQYLERAAEFQKGLTSFYLY